jgi:hypothetical protein
MTEAGAPDEENEKVEDIAHDNQRQEIAPGEADLYVNLILKVPTPQATGRRTLHSLI